MELSEMTPIFKKWETIQSENAISLTGNKDHPNACLVYMLYCLANQRPFNLAYYMAKRMVGVIKNDVMVLPYDLMSWFLSPRDGQKGSWLMGKGLLYQLPPHFFSSQSQSQNQEDNDPVNNFELEPIDYYNQLPPILDTLEKFKQPKGMFKCLSYFLSNFVKKKKKHPDPFYSKGRIPFKRDLVDPDPQNLPRKVARTCVIDISSNESSPLREPINNLITTHLATPQVSPLTSPIATPLLTLQPNAPTTLAPRELVFTTPSTSPHPYLNTLEDLPPRCANPPPLLTLEQIVSQPLPFIDHMDIEPLIPPTNLTRRNGRLSVFTKPFLTRAQIVEELNQLHDLSNDIDTAIQNAQNVQNRSTNPITTTTSQVPPLPSHLPSPQTFVPLDQSVWIDGPSSIPPSHKHTCVHCQHTQTIIHEIRDEMRFMFHHILEHLTNLTKRKP
ncbi:hypothetical protein Tco_0764359 [Tanacetum coccineum]